MGNKSKYAVITGATGGMGLSFAHQLAAKNYNLIITDVNENKLQKLAQELKNEYQIDVKDEQVDLTDEKQLTQFAKKLMNLEGVEMLVNCAGFGEGEKFYKEPMERQLKMIQVHITATVHLVHAVLPGMIHRRNGKIITVSSMAAFIPAPGSSIYAATKSFLNSFMETIHMEVHKYGIQVQSLCPGLTKTGFHKELEKEKKRSNLNKIVPWMEADEVVKLSLKCLEKGKVVCIPGCFNKTIKKTIPILPRQSFYKLTEKISGKNL